MDYQECEYNVHTDDPNIYLHGSTQQSNALKVSSYFSPTKITTPAGNSVWCGTLANKFCNLKEITFQPKIYRAAEKNKILTY